MNDSVSSGSVYAGSTLKVGDVFDLGGCFYSVSSTESVGADLVKVRALPCWEDGDGTVIVLTLPALTRFEIHRYQENPPQVARWMG